MSKINGLEFARVIKAQVCCTITLTPAVLLHTRARVKEWCVIPKNMREKIYFSTGAVDFLDDKNNNRRYYALPAVPLHSEGE